MKSKHVFFFAFLMVGVLLFLTLSSIRSAGVTQPRRTVPTAAPTPTAGVRPTHVVSLTSSDLLATKTSTTPEQAVQRAFQFDPAMADWDEPWSPATLTLEPSRITVELFPSVAAEDGSVYGPGVEAEIGPVWRITIHGSVQIHFPFTIDTRDASTTRYDGMTYVIAQRTGELIATRSGNRISR